MKKYNCIKQELRFTEEVEKELKERFDIERTGYDGQYTNGSIFISIASWDSTKGYNIYVSIHYSKTIDEKPDFAELFDLYREVYFYVKGLK